MVNVHLRQSVSVTLTHYTRDWNGTELWTEHWTGANGDDEFVRRSMGIIAKLSVFTK